MEENGKIIEKGGEEKGIITPPPANNPIQAPVLKNTDELIVGKVKVLHIYQFVCVF